MFKFCSLYSGSTGNSLFVETPNTKILIDAGESAKKIVSALSNICVDIENIDAILVTHEHSDHVKGLGTLSKKYNIPVYSNNGTWQAMPVQSSKIENSNKRLFNSNKLFSVGELKIFPFSIPHDAAEPCGFNIYYNNNKISIATDLGHIDSNIISKLENSSFILLESNYDPEILKCSSYPYNLKQRISGPYGHLSNILAGQAISYLAQNGLKSVMLGHLSKENNFPELAYKTVMNELIESNKDFDYSSFNLSIAKRYEPSPIIKLA